MDCIAAQEFFGIQTISSRLHMSVKNHQTTVNSQEIYLSTKEFDVLYMLYSNPDVTYTKEQIYEAVWHVDKSFIGIVTRKDIMKYFAKNIGKTE